MSRAEEDAPGHPCKGVLFDATGTLIELCESVGTTYSRHAAPYGAALPAWRLDDAFGRVLSHAPPRVFPGVPRTAAEQEEIAWWRAIVRSTFLAADSTVKFSDYDDFYRRLFAHFSTPEAWRCRPGVVDGLRALRVAGLAIGVASNFDHRLPKILQALELAELIDATVIPLDCGCEKPDAGIFVFACEALGLEARAVTHVGDDLERDVRGARDAGLRGLSISDFESFDHLVREITAG